MSPPPADIGDAMSRERSRAPSILALGLSTDGLRVGLRVPVWLHSCGMNAFAQGTSTAGRLSKPSRRRWRWWRRLLVGGSGTLGACLVGGLGPITVLAAPADLSATSPARSISAGATPLGEVRTGVRERWWPPLASLAVTAPFDPPTYDWLPGHRGVDLAATNGEAVRAPALGTVVFAGVIADRPVLVIDHGTLRSTYEPVTAAQMVGQSVAAGSVIGSVSSGGHCGTRCMHWGAISGDTYIDPMLLVRGYVPVLKTPW